MAGYHWYSAPPLPSCCAPSCCVFRFCFLIALPKYRINPPPHCGPKGSRKAAPRIWSVEIYIGVIQLLCSGVVDAVRGGGPYLHSASLPEHSSLPQSSAAYTSGMGVVGVRRYIYRSARCYVNRSSAYEADDPAVDSKADGSAVDILRCIRMRIQSTICIESRSLQIDHHRIQSTKRVHSLTVGSGWERGGGVLCGL